MEKTDEILTPTSNAGNGKKSNKVKTHTSGTGVITTPTRNQFDAFDTENELNAAFQNLQNSESDKKLALITLRSQRSKINIFRMAQALVRNQIWESWRTYRIMIQMERGKI